jgi:hypothetical protein
MRRCFESDGVSEGTPAALIEPLSAPRQERTFCPGPVSRHAQRGASSNGTASNGGAQTTASP